MHLTAVGFICSGLLWLRPQVGLLVIQPLWGWIEAAGMGCVALLVVCQCLTVILGWTRGSWGQRYGMEQCTSHVPQNLPCPLRCS